ncbi:s-adenosylmethionine [Aquipluma nitroreducens]|uniref:S-adenosylmethionine:tRNA ribosyltransferase-isomerase n=1 Tax=Aquipluma nitroreducens TaxID=2010828 RepID=A0A5K7SDU6_9BACT|nr:S-adenosylmethionine:tRNA ribosyltransferase-isomerase [Aquipluma nitroreducens]BBE19743.1 s-adenosylmethionine [Aquipluma nitroreducens]
MESTNKLLEKVTGISISDYAYDLPDEKIAKYPLDERDQSKLLVWKNGLIQDSQFENLPEFLPSNSLLIFNNTKVIRARLHFQKETGAKIELFCLDPVDPSDYQIAFQTTQSCVWKCMIGNQKKWKGDRLRKIITIDETEIELCAEQTDPENNKSLIQFSWNNPDFEFSRIIESAGSLPIPPYLNRETEQSDLERYQTVYSKIKGSVAAPTAGLHFTDKVFSHLTEDGHEMAELTLHVGAGTFQPVKSEILSGHEMHSEHLYISRDFLKKLIGHSGKKIAVGTTSVRTLESLYWLGLQAHQNPEMSISDLKVTQWEAYQAETSSIEANIALQALIQLLERNQAEYLSASTQIIIAPGYQFRIVDGLITNFHQPQSTLLLLISAYLGDEWQTIYDHALTNNYRFLSYGDSNLYLKS